MEYALQCAKRMHAENIRAIEVRQEPIDHLYQHIELWHARSVWCADCKSWYKTTSSEAKYGFGVGVPYIS